MTRPVLRRAAACLLAAVLAATGTALLTPAGPATAASESANSTRSPLRVSVETMTPSVLPPSGRVTLTGQVTNRSQEDWTSLRAYLFTSRTPMTSADELAAAAATSEFEPVGERLTSDGLYDDLGDLAPGETTSYRVSVPRRSLGIGSAPGVYWIGVHVLGGSDSTGRDTVADGRARTFVPQLPQGTTPTRLALVVPVKNEVRRGAAGRLLGLPGWQRSVGTDGRLDRLLNLSGRATAPITWVVDPAVLDAVTSVAQDNPKIDPGPDGSAGGGSPSASPSPSGSTSPSAGASTDQGDAGDVSSAAEPSPQAVAARAWLEEFRRQAPTHEVTTVPYGDLDVAAALGTPLAGLYQQATDLSALAMTALGLEAGTPVVDPVSGRLPDTALRDVDPRTPVLLSESAFPRAQRTVLTRDGRAPVVRTDDEAGDGGPRPNSRYAALAMRQRLLSDAALHALSSDAARPLVVSTPPYWDPGSAWASSDFFAGLDQPWLRLTDLPSVVSGGELAPADASGERTPVYPRSERRAELPASNLQATRRLAGTGSTYGRLLPDNDTVQHVLDRVAMLASSQNVRDDPAGAVRQADSTTGYLRAQMQEVRIEGPRFVMMSGEQGPIQITLVNGLDQPVRVGIAAQTRSSGLRISRIDPVTLGPGKRTAIRLKASSNDIGVHAVTLVATDTEGNPLGSLTQLSVRTSRVSTVVWVIMAAGAVLLFLAIAVRLFRRVRRRRATHGPRLQRGVDA
ncbi:hypothetical protein KRR39_20180 [Nocardioides panacis]|uniref:Secreted protein n=1 Tax=Nocardioides panacis TaxID=2849501 RepID=A0A975T396_9ACTN|nr:DUF6049 family protein [Nocardioides panacis]QWZ10772.1 hypothetical protein KRR39_20180 [Nocardioides panacis]